MPDIALVVIGDRFSDFLAHRGTIAASAVLERLRTGDLPPSVTLSVGQGLTQGQLIELGQLTAQTGHRLRPDPAPAHARYPQPRGYAVVGPVTRVGDREFQGRLLLDDQLGILDDHLNSQHIPAITLLEAARQTWTMVAEELLATTPRRKDMVIGEIRTIRSDFRKYLFPLPATVICLVTEQRQSPVGEIAGFEVTIIQADALAARIEAEIQLLPRALVTKQEMLAARQSLHNELAALRPEG